MPNTSKMMSTRSGWQLGFLSMYRSQTMKQTHQKHLFCGLTSTLQRLETSCDVDCKCISKTSPILCSWKQGQDDPYFPSGLVHLFNDMSSFPILGVSGVICHFYIRNSCEQTVRILIRRHILPISLLWDARNKIEPPHDKTNKMTVRPANTQISLGIHLVWSQSSLCAQWVAKDLSFLHADSEDSDQTGRVPRLIWVFAGRTCYYVGFVMRRLRGTFDLNVDFHIIHVHAFQ